MAIYSAPTDLVATVSSASTIGLVWANSEPALQTEIQRKEYGGTYHTIHAVDAGETTYTDSTCSANTRYYYRARHFTGAYGYSDWCTEDSEYTLPATPTGFTVTWSGKTATLTWTNASVYDYSKVYYKLTADSSWTTDTETLTYPAYTRDITVASESTAYQFRVRGYNSESTYNSDYATAASSLSGVMAPTDLAGISGGATTVALTWTDNSSVEDGYEVYYKLSTDTDYTLFETTAADATTSTVTGLTGDLTYNFKIRAKDGTAYSAYTSVIDIVVITPPAGTPGTPTAVITGQTTATVTWTDTATGLTRMYLYQSTDDVTYTEVGYVANAIETYAVTGLTSYTTYYFKTRAWNTAGWSTAYSSASTVVTTTIDLDPPTLLTADALSSTQIKISFTVNAGNATSHSVERKTSGSAYASVGSTAAGTTATYTDGTCSANTEYTYRIRAYNSVSLGYGDYSVPVTKTTLNVGTDSVRRNEAYFAMGNVLCIASETPQNSFNAYWRSKPIDFGEL
ncbi:MAG: fibronectin type III domain-containing protein, partial [Sphaerochaeta sp.]|nr:fibronectin type III domain-containing protein [Sphaerochaeta sp.]